MRWPSQCAVVFPCLNEAATIESLVHNVRRLLPAVIVVDDGSTDSTAALAAAAGADVVRNDRPSGQVAALSAGWKRAQERGFSWAFSMYGDGQHAPSDIPAFLNCAERTGARLIVGNRMVNAVAIPWLRRHVNRWMSCRISRLTGHD